MRLFKPSASNGTTISSMDAAHMKDLIGRVNDLVVADLVVQQFPVAELHGKLPGTYLVAQERVKRAQISYARAKSVGKTVRAASVGLGKFSVWLVKSTAKGCVAAVKLGLSIRSPGRRTRPVSARLIELSRAPHAT